MERVELSPPTAAEAQTLCRGDRTPRARPDGVSCVCVLTSQSPENLCQGAVFTHLCILAFSASSLHAYTSVQLAVTKKPGGAVRGEENTWLRGICSLLATAQGQHCRPRWRLSAPKTSSRREARQTRGCWFQTTARGDSGARGDCFRAPRMGRYCIALVFICSGK